MRYWDVLRSRMRSVFFRDRREADLHEELEFHLEREGDRLEATGMPREAARLQARRTFGGAAHIKDACRDARGTAFLDDTIRDILYALRVFKRTPFVALTVVSTVALGLGLVTVAFTSLNMLLFRVDQVPNVHEMFALDRPRDFQGDRVPFTRAQFDSLRRETSIFTDAFAQVADVDSRVDGRRISGAFVTGNFFQVLDVHARIGRAFAPGDDEPSAGPPVIVLSDRGWDRLFARDPSVLGRTVIADNVAFEVVGVMPAGFRGLAAGPPDDYWAPLSTLARIRPVHRGREAEAGVEIVGRLKPGTSRQSALAVLAVWATRQPDGTPIDRGLSGIDLVPRRGTVQQPGEAVLVTAPLFIAFGLILLIGCANVTNLLLARGVARQREIGVRLSLGATRRRIVRQLLTESLLLAIAAATAGFAISRVALEVIINALMRSWPPEIGDIRLLMPDTDWRVMLFLLAGAAVSTMFFGLVPALQATRIEPLRTIRGEMVRDARPGRARDFLIGLQVCASALLLISAGVFLRSALTAATANPGMRITDTILVDIANEARRTSIVQAVTTEPSVAAVAAVWPEFEAGPRAAFAEASGAKATVGYRFVSPEYFGVLDIAIVQGRTFMPAERTPDLPVAVVSETTARSLWPNASAIGQTVRLSTDAKSGERRTEERPFESRTFTVVGVVRDVPGFRMVPLPDAFVYIPTNATAAGTSLVARVHGDPEVALRTLSDRLTAIDPTMARLGSMVWITRMETYLLGLGFWFTVVLGGLALALTVSGLFSVLSYLVEQRTREIGVRMALGATARNVTRLVLSQSIRPVGLGILIGAGSAAGLAALLLSSPSAGPIGELVQVLDPIAYGVSLLIILAACLAAASIPASRAAHLDPTTTLRQE